MIPIVAILSCILLSQAAAAAAAANFGTFLDGNCLSPTVSTLGAPSTQQQQARASIILEDDVASIDNLNLISLNYDDDEESILSDDLVIGMIGETRRDETFEHVHDNRQRLQLALSSSSSSSFLDKSQPNNEIPLLSSSYSPTLRSTGTTIVGCLVEDGKYVVLGADTRATDDRMVADKDCEKIHTIASNIYVCGAGTSADLEATTRLAQYSLHLQALQETSIGNVHDVSNESNYIMEEGGILLQPVSVSAACRFLRDLCFDQGGSLGVNLILGGYDIAANQGRLVAIHPHGSMDVVPFAALGSGGLAAMSVLESRYRPSLTLKEGEELIKAAVLAGIENDLGSGSQVDMCVLGPGGSVDYQQGVVPEQELENIQNHNESIDKSILQYTGSSSGGVNGFGNLPFAINSRRVIASQHDETTKIEQWNSLLGLTKK